MLPIEGFKSILVCSDLTPVSGSALELAVDLARDHLQSLHVLHVVTLPPEIKRWSQPLFSVDLKLYRQLLDRQLEAAKKELNRQLRPYLRGPVWPQTLVRAGLAAEVIAETANELAVDLIVVARGTGGALGPTAERVVRLAGRTVLVTPVRRPLAASASGELAKPPKRGRRARATA